MTEETKAEKFERLSDARLTKVLDALRILGNLANRRDYEFTDEQASALIEAIYGQTDELAESFEVPKRGQAPRENTGMAEALPVEGDIDPYGPKARRKEMDGKRLRVEPGEWTDVELIRAGPHLGLAMEAIMDGNGRAALDYLKKVMSA